MLLNGLSSALGDTQREAITLEEAQTRWQQALRDKRCLLVIDDVWQIADLHPLLEGGPHCTRLVTTRNDRVLPSDATRVVVDAMSSQEALSFLCQDLPADIQQAFVQKALAQLAKQLGYWPLLLSLARGLLETQLRYGHPVTQALGVVQQISQGMPLQADVALNFQEMVNISLQTGFRQLEKVVPAHSQPIERYQELAIFPEDTDIPLSILQRFWQATGGLEPWETEDLCMQLYDLSLLQLYDLDSGTIRLHDVTRGYLIQRACSLVVR